MKQVSIQDLKATLSSVVADAERGETVVVTRHNEPVAHIGPARVAHVRRGDRIGRKLEPAVRRATKGRYLEILADDRNER